MDSPIDFRELPPEERIAAIGHRAFVGGNDPETWYGIGLLQFHFLISRGLKPSHVFLDVGCGSLRLGQFLIPYLEDEHYFGLEAEPALVQAGLVNELRFDLAALKRPLFGCGYDFDLSFVSTFDFAMAQSLFTHLTPSDIRACLSNLRAKAHSASQLFFTFFEGVSANNPEISHANRNWRYSREELVEMAAETGWMLDYIGDWQHPRKQKMFRAMPSR